jgi:hypothetical protein
VDALFQRADGRLERATMTPIVAVPDAPVESPAVPPLDAIVLVDETDSESEWEEEVTSASLPLGGIPIATNDTDDDEDTPDEDAVPGVCWLGLGVAILPIRTNYVPKQNVCVREKDCRA